MPKPIFVMKLRSSITNSQMEMTREVVSISDMRDDYYIIVTHNHIDEDKFEMYNSDKIEPEAWDELVNKILNKSNET
jgi:hypothetical protein